METKQTGYRTKQYGVPVKRFVQTLDLVDDAELIASYRKCHSKEEIWKEILQGIRDCGILEMEIYIAGNRLTMIVDAPLDWDWEEGMKKMAAGPRQDEWEAFVASFQKCAEGAKSDEKWTLMERMFHLYDD